MSISMKRPISDHISATTTTNQQQQQEPSTSSSSSSSKSRSHKRLRLSARKWTHSGASIATYASLLETTTSSNDALQLLIQISDSLQYTDEDISESVAKLSEHYRRETQSAVRVKILSLFSEWCATSTGSTSSSTTETASGGGGGGGSGSINIDETILIDEICLLIKTETSAKVVAQGLHSLYKIGAHTTLATAVLAKIDAVAKGHLLSYSHNIQKHALLLLGAFTPLADAERETMQLVGKYTDSQDSRVRAQAFRSILTLGKRGAQLAPSLYVRATKALTDDYECVRKEALQLVFELGVRHPEQ